MIRQWLSVCASVLLVACGGAETAAPVAAPQSTSTVGSTGAPSPQPAGGDVLPAPMQQALDAHNSARLEHCAPPLAWSNEVASEAAAWADQLVARGCPLEHSRSRYGENLFMGTSGQSSPSDVVAAWVSERSQYNFRNGGFSMQTGHFTQVVWAGSTQLGCAMRTCANMDLWVCNYNSAGNVQGQFPQNVNATSCR